MSEKKRFKIVYQDDGINKTAKGYCDNPDVDFIKVTSFEGTIYINKKHIVFMRELGRK